MSKTPDQPDQPNAAIDPVIPEVPGDVTLERVRAALHERGEFLADLPESVLGEHDLHTYTVALTGHYLNVTTRWSRTIPAPARRAASQLVNDWNRDRIMPTLYSHAGEDGIGLSVRSSLSTVVGATDRQLSDFIESSVVAARHALRTLDTSVPRPPGPLQ